MLRKWILVFSLSLLGWSLLLGTALAVGAESGAGQCVDPYVVRRGDTLGGIARRLGVPLQDLIAYNAGSITHPDLIYPGQTLCLPVARRFTIQATYQYAPDGAENDAVVGLTTRAGLIGRQQSFPVRSVEMVSTTEEVLAYLAASPAPRLIAYRNGPDLVTYTLVAVGDLQPLLDLALTASGPITVPGSEGGTRCVPRPVASLAATETLHAEARMILEAGSGLFYPFEVTQVVYRTDATRARNCFLSDADGTVGFLLIPAVGGRPGEYDVIMRATDGVIGPPGATRAVRCRRWPLSGWFYRWLRAWYGCR